MNALPGPDGHPTGLRLEFYPRQGPGAFGTGAPPEVVIPARAWELVAPLARDLAFEVARRRPDLEGRELVLGLEGSSQDPVPGLVLLVAKEAGTRGAWTDTPAVATLPVLPDGVDRRPLAPALSRRGLDAKDHVFRIGIQAGGGEAPGLSPPRSRLRSTSWTDREPAATVRVPAYPEGDVPGRAVELDPCHAASDDLAVYVPARALDAVVEDERRYATQEGPGWKERAWVGLGDVVRTGGDLAVRVKEVVPAQGTAGAAGWVAFTAATWEALARTGESLGGSPVLWLHAHRVSQLAAAGEPAEVPAPEVSRGVAAGGGIGEQDPPSGLWLSAMDRDAARAAFRHPAMVTAVLCSDACSASSWGAVPLGRTFGAWGWMAGLLVRRSLRIHAEALRPAGGR